MDEKKPIKISIYNKKSKFICILKPYWSVDVSFQGIKINKSLKSIVTCKDFRLNIFL